MSAYRIKYEFYPVAEKGNKHVYEIHKIVQKEKDGPTTNKVIKKIVSETHDKAKEYVAKLERRL